jgi:hypothetical protein
MKHPDTERLDKLKRIEKELRGARYFFNRDGIVVAAKKKQRGDGRQYYRALRDAIDATPEPPEAA